MLKIELDGTKVLSGGQDGLLILAGSSMVRGLVINRFTSSGILVSINGGNLIEGNFIGTDVTGAFDLGNSQSGVFISGASDNMIGGTGAGAGNVISGNNNAGVSIVGGSFGNVVQGNLIGTDVTGTLAVGNRFDGVEIENAPNNLIGGTTAGAGNVLSGNHSGIYIGGFGATGNLVQGNLIGTDVAGTAPLGNIGDGIEFRSANGNTVGGTGSNASNTIAYNGGDGVAVFSGMDNAILSNSISSNVGLGIDLIPNGVTLNDSGDGDAGANNLQNFPVLTSAASGSTNIVGTLNSTANTTFRLEFFPNAACDPTGYGEGENFLGSTDATGNLGFSINFPDVVPGGRFITGTATDPNGNTSEFSQCMQVVRLPATFTVTSTADANDSVLLDGVCDDGTSRCTLRAAIEQAISGDTIDIPAGTYTLTQATELAIDKDLTLTGAGSGDTIIQAAASSADATSRVFNITVGKVVISGVTIRHGKVTGDRGGGIYNTGTLTLIGSTVTNNVLDAGGDNFRSGGGIANIDGTTTVIGSTFSVNKTTSGDGGNNGGAIFNFIGTLTVTDSHFMDNRADNGGALMNDQGTLSVTRSTFASNSARYNGGAIHGNGTSVVTNTTFYRNGVAGGRGGAVYNHQFGIGAGIFTLTNSTVISNTAAFDGGGIYNQGIMTLANSLLDGNTADSYGGAIYNQVGGVLTIATTTISGNSGGKGGGMINGGTFTIANSTINDNIASCCGGGIENEGTGDITNSTISGNDADSDGGIVHYGPSKLTVTNSTISNNTANFAGGIRRHSGTLELNSTIIAGNIASIGPDCRGVLTSLGHNLIGTSDGCSFTPASGDLVNVDPKLGPLQDNGGPTLTHALLPGSPAIDAGDDSVLGPPHNLTTDQRGEPRRQGAHVDIGAYEFEPLVLVDTNGDGVVDTADLSIVTASLNTQPSADTRADVNGDGKVDIGDLVEVAIYFGRTAP